MPEATEEKTKELSAVRRRSLSWTLPLAMLAIAGAWYWSVRGNVAAAPESGEAAVKSTLHLETFVLNLADPNERVYLRVGVDLGLSREIKHGEELPVAATRDTILGVLAECRADEVMAAAGKRQLKERLLHALQQRVPQLNVEEVYFTEFLVQR